MPTLTHNLIRTATSIGNAFITMDVLLSEGNIWPPVKMEGFSFYIPRFHKQVVEAQSELFKQVAAWILILTFLL